MFPASTFTRLAAVAAMAAAGLAVPASASVVLIDGDTNSSTEGLCDFSGSIQYDYLGGNDGMVTFTLTNTTDLDVGGFLTGFVFNVGGYTVDLDLISTTDIDFAQVPDNENGNPYGTFRSGASLGGDFLGGGSPMDGIAIGDTGIFQFDLESVDAGMIDASTFLTGANEFNFITRFRGLNDGGSDKVPGGNIPAPGALALLGLAGLTAARRNRA
jgi:MYXO-CTERM domain-containing protein